MQSSDGYLEEEIDPSVYAQLDAIEAAHFIPAAVPAPDRFIASAPRSLLPDDSYGDMSFDIDESELQRLDEVIESAYSGKEGPVAGPSGAQRQRTTSKDTVQTTLFGDILPQKSTVSKSNSSPRVSSSTQKSSPRNAFGQQAPKTKQWDQTAFAKSGLKLGKSKGKGKANEGEEECEPIEFEQFPPPLVSGQCICSFIRKFS
jgi:ATP-dependent DNA helicase MPH1